MASEESTEFHTDRVRLSADGAPLRIVPMTFAEACTFVSQHHRHHRPPAGHKFSIGVAAANCVVGVAIVGRPVSRVLDDGWTLEVNRVATDGTRSANSMLYGACRRAAWALGYHKLVTYTLPEEGGASPRAAGYRLVGEAGGGSWDTPTSGRPRVDRHPTQVKWRWEA